MKSEILLGDEAVALGAIHAGMTAAYSYPGTPASEIMEYLIKISRRDRTFHATWCINEKVAFEESLGVSFAGKRTMVSMKHVGLNVAADPFMNSALTGTGGGLVVAVATTPACTVPKTSRIAATTRILPGSSVSSRPATRRPMT